MSVYVDETIFFTVAPTTNVDLLKADLFFFCHASGESVEKGERFDGAFALSFRWNHVPCGIGERVAAVLAKHGCCVLEVIRSIDAEYATVHHIGVKITTNKQVVLLEMDGSQHCCEHFGRGIVFPPDASAYDMEGDALLYSVEIGTDWEWNKPVVDDDVEQDRDSGSVTVKMHTSVGLLKAYMYNIHNGYYPHEYSILWKDYKNEGHL